jgi:hypothetical protein
VQKNIVTDQRHLAAEALTEALLEVIKELLLLPRTGEKPTKDDIIQEVHKATLACQWLLEGAEWAGWRSDVEAKRSGLRRTADAIEGRAEHERLSKGLRGLSDALDLIFRTCHGDAHSDVN